MTKLKYTLKSDTLFKLLFAKNQKLLKRLVSALLGIRYEDITEFNVINPEKFHHEFQCLEVTTYVPLTDKMVLHFYELKKLPPLADTDSGRDLWLKLFNAETEEELKKIESMEVSFMSEAVMAYRHVAASSELRELERMRSKAGHDEAQAIYNAERKERERWQGVVAEKDTALAEQAALIAKLQEQIKTQQ